MNDQATSTGTVYEDFWFEGDLHHSVTYTCQPGRSCVETTEYDLYATSRLVGFIDIQTSMFYLCNYDVDDPRAVGWDIETFRECPIPGDVTCCPSAARDNKGFTISSP
jgi:hypothetical protein